ncbi:MAG: ABC transporter permease subunit [Spirochaetaceae bacterium]|jgi:NitT/TauT family transport system permease protein|nr:ABC transporter permease subunit [Spirochaetaceae bacterium]
MKRFFRPLWFWSFAGAVTLVVLWEVSSRLMGSDLIFPGPLPVLGRFLTLVQSRVFLESAGRTFLRVCLGLCISAPLGIAAGLAAGLEKRAGAFLEPFFKLISATPVMAVILIVFLVFNAERTPVFTVFLMAFPVLSANTVQGVRSVDPGLKEMVRAYGFSGREKLVRLYLPSIVPFIAGGLKSALSLSWKVAVAAEVLVQPFRALGTGMQRAKARLETAELFAWTAATVLAAGLSELLFTLLMRRWKKGASP